MKKLIALLLALLMITGAAMAETAEMPEAEENAYLSQEELEMYLDVLAGDALAMGVDHAEADPDTGLTTVTYAEGATLLIADETLSETTAILGATLNEMQEDMRGIHIGDTLADVLSVYPNDNPGLLGSRYDAALYVDDERPQASVGYILRDGQRITEVTHLVFTWEEDAVVRCGITYSFDWMDVVIGIRIFGLEQHADPLEAMEEISNVATIQENREYAAYPVSLYSGDQSAFEEADLSFGGIDFAHLTPDMAVAALGTPSVDDWMEDSTGEWLRTLQWEGVSVVFVCDNQRNFLHVDNLTVNDDILEGPRGVRIDDSIDSVMNRFQHDTYTQLANGIALYGDGENAPYGVLAYGEVTATLTYAVNTAAGQRVIWQLTFIDGQLQSHVMLLR
ncbi:MAG: hypothetical protein IJ189_06170 [Clostridia bacterium]|nr:hypothetical protein [Clostridia bacterium]